LRTPQSPRDEHVKWNGMILPANDPWWNTHFPPNGWGCTCGIIALTKKQAQEAGGVSSQIPEGDADKGWVGNPGKREGGVNAVFESAQRFEKDEPQLHTKFLAGYAKDLGNYSIEKHGFEITEVGMDWKPKNAKSIYGINEKKAQPTKKLTEQEQQAIRSYTREASEAEGGFRELNPIARGQKKGTKAARERLELLKGAISKFETKEPIVLFRAQADTGFELGEYTDNAFLSTTTNPGKAINGFAKPGQDNVLIKILVKKGTQAAPINKYSIFGEGMEGKNQEHEFLINTGTKKRVLSVENVSDLLKNEKSDFLESLQKNRITKIITLAVG